MYSVASVQCHKITIKMTEPDFDDPSKFSPHAKRVIAEQISEIKMLRAHIMKLERYGLIFLEKVKMTKGITLTGAVTFNSPMIDIHDNQHVHVHTTVAPGLSDEEAEETEEDIGNEEDNQEEIVITPRKKEEPNYFQTARFLKAVLTVEWFDEFRTKEGYSQKWRAAFIDALMESEYGEGIAWAWESEKKRETLKAYLVGCLKEAGVIRGSYDEIAKAMGYDNKTYRTFSRYLCRGKQQPFFFWIRDYVSSAI